MLQALSGQAAPADLIKAIYAETEGNPFFVEEVFQHLSEEERLFDDDGQWRADLRVEDLDVPEGIRLVIGRRVERLSSTARQVLTSAAVVGRSFDLTLLDALGDAEGDALLTALEEAEAARLIQAVASGREVRWEFSHGLIRQTLENSLSLMRRQRAHLRVAETLERVYGEHVERHASDLAQHLYQAGMGADPDKTVRFLTLAWDQALQRRGVRRSAAAVHRGRVDSGRSGRPQGACRPALQEGAGTAQSRADPGGCRGAAAGVRHLRGTTGRGGRGADHHRHGRPDQLGAGRPTGGPRRCPTWSRGRGRERHWRALPDARGAGSLLVAGRGAVRCGSRGAERG